MEKLQVKIGEMKKVKTVGLAILAVGLLTTSCSSIYYYQIYKVQPIGDLSKSNHWLIHEDANCIILYDFWEEGGNAGFLIYNKLEKNIYVNMKESFFICNGIAYDYYRNREFTSQKTTSHSSMHTSLETSTYSVSKAISVSGNNYYGFRQTNSISAGIVATKTLLSGISTSASSSTALSSGVSIKEKDIICIPPNSAKVFSEYSINKSLYRDCNLFLYPSKKQISTSSFSKEESPFVFGNRISYFLEGIDTPIIMEHTFYVSEISNYSEKDITEFHKYKECEDDQSTQTTTKYIKTAPDKFYNIYLLGR